MGMMRLVVENALLFHYYYLESCLMGCSWRRLL